MQDACADSSDAAEKWNPTPGIRQRACGAKTKMKPDGSMEGHSQEATVTEDGRARPKWWKRQDVWLMVSGIAFILALIGGMYGLGHWRGWDAISGHTHNTSMTSSQRFLPEPTDPDPYPTVRGRTDRPDAAGLWYYWKNRPDDVTIWSRLFVWLAYVSHQIAVWVLIYLAQVDRLASDGKKYDSRLNKYNWAMFAVNILFHVLHLVQSHVTYDGLAQDVTITSSQGSVIMALMVVMLLEYNERGLFFGWPTAKNTGRISQRLRLNLTPVYLIRKYHGYGIAWAAVYTFWYHPMENTYGHVLGFFHTWILLLQGSLMFSPLHLNKWWRLLLEVWVTLHAALVGYQTGGPAMNGTLLWPMFLFGFLCVLVLTQIFLLSFWQKLPGWVRSLPIIAWLIITIACYSAIPDADGNMWVRLQEVIRIPLIMYIGFIFLWSLLYFFLWVDQKIQKDAPIKEASTTSRSLHLFGFGAIYVGMVGISVMLEIFSAPIYMFVLMVLLILVFLFGVAAATLCLKHALPLSLKSSYKVNDIDLHSSQNPIISNSAAEVNTINPPIIS